MSTGLSLSEDLNNLSIGGIRVKMFDRERTIVDSFRYLSKEVAIKALKRYLKRGHDQKPDIKKLVRYAKSKRPTSDAIP